MSEDVAVRFQQVNKWFPGKVGNIQILQDISGEVPTGKILTIVGPSGSGKSTLLSLCNLLLTPDGGEVRIHGKEVRKWDIPQLRREVGLVFQMPTMFPGSVLDNLALPARLRREELRRPEEYMESVGLSEELLSRKAEDLSGGQKQRVSIARALVNRPSVLLLDEITSALDPAAAKAIEELILRIRREQGTTILWVTHDLEQARRVGDLTWLLAGGRLVEARDTQSFFEQPEADLTREFLHGELSGRGSV
ncbi:ABC transporter ATP-binding protein [Effusibacillus pohliae]|uniref:ABC transporter ATP-binding protein n=1 Tax=Effusibacillus pohliae TaxID=232270 RepID=UPI000376BF15|nr:phosphate ABC transporter ATP-binding protein [Effusibacillus pohliae]